MGATVFATLNDNACDYKLTENSFLMKRDDEGGVLTVEKTTTGVCGVLIKSTES